MVGHPAIAGFSAFGFALLQFLFIKSTWGTHLGKAPLFSKTFFPKHPGPEERLTLMDSQLSSWEGILEGCFGVDPFYLPWPMTELTINGLAAVMAGNLIGTQGPFLDFFAHLFHPQSVGM